eukprot:COSAG02_NODE_10505_length_1926_cov_3.770662_3_plen_153_part_00
MESPQEEARNLPAPKRSRSAGSDAAPDSSQELREAGSAPLPALALPFFSSMNAAAGVAADSLPVEDWMRAAFPPQIANEPWELQGALEVLCDFLVSGASVVDFYPAGEITKSRGSYKVLNELGFGTSRQMIDYLREVEAWAPDRGTFAAVRQ